MFVGALSITLFTDIEPIGRIYAWLVDRQFNVAIDEFLVMCAMAGARAIGPPWLACTVATTWLSLIESRGILATERTTLDLSKLNPVQGAKRLVSMQVLKDLLRSVLYLVLFIAVASWLMRDTLRNVLSLRHTASLGEGWLGVSAGAALVTLMVVLPVAILAGVIDYVMFIRSMRMDKHEIRKEHEENDGKPEIKQRRREMAAELSAQIKSDVRGSSAVLANPTHIAVGIWLNRELAEIPFVSVRERGDKARAVIAYAEEVGVPVIRDVRLARRLYASSRRYQFVPLEELEPVLRLLRWLEDVERAGAERIP